jgi:hypothetical protein
MDVEMSKASGPETPASCMAEYVMEHVTALMTLGGIESISAQKYVCGFGSRLHVTIAPFANAPDAVKAQGVVIKDALAQIMSIANITRVVMKPSKADVKKMVEAWKSSTKDADSVNGGSGQDFSGSRDVED